MTRTAPRPEVSVVIPTRDRWPLLSRALESVLRQQDVSLEIVVVDDRSTDATLHNLAAMDDVRLRVVHNQRAGTVAGVRNLGIERATGEWLAFLDDDDLWAPHKLRRQLDAARTRSASFAYTGALHIDPRARVIREALLPDPNSVGHLLLRRNCVPGGCSNAIARTAAVRELGGFDERLHVTADWDLWLRMTSSARSAAVGENLVAYTEHPGNMVVRDTDRALGEFDVLSDKHERRARAAGVQLDGLEFNRWVAEGVWRAGRRQTAVALFGRALARYPSGSNLRHLVKRAAARQLRALPPSRRLPDPDWLATYRDHSRGRGPARRPQWRD